MNEVNQIINSLESLINTDLSDTQMDLLFNRQVILQIYNQSDFEKWSIPIEIPFENKGGIILDLTFAKGKNNNEANFNRFKTNNLFPKFHFLQQGNAKSYFYQISGPVDMIKTASIIANLLIEIYDLKNGDYYDILVQSF